MELNKQRVSTYSQIMIILGLVIFALIYFRNLIQPFVLALVVWYLIRSIRDGISKISIKNRSLPKWFCAILAIVITFTFLGLIIQIVSYNLGLIVDKSDDYEKNINLIIQNTSGFISKYDVGGFFQNQLTKIDIQAFGTKLLSAVSGMLGNIALILIYVIFMLVEENFLSKKLEAITFDRSKRKESLTHIFSRISNSINIYFYVKVIVSLITGLLSYLVLLLIGVDFAVLWAFLIFIFNFIPYIGSLVATVFPALFALFQFAEFGPFLWVLISVMMIQVLVGNYVEPQVMGRTLNISPLIVILSLSFWGTIWGVVGMILSVPIISVITIIMAHFPQTQSIAIIFSEKGNIESFVSKG